MIYQKHRPQSFDEMIGNKETVTAIESELGFVAPCQSFLLTGPSGCGKTTVGRIIADNIGSHGLDFIEVDSADFRGIDTVRAIRQNAQLRPLESDKRVWLLDECHQLSRDAQHALLKILEDTPLHVTFILCTTEPQRLLETIRNRCMIFQMSLLDFDEMQSLIVRSCKKEKYKPKRKIIEAIINNSAGSPRKALVILSKIMNADQTDQDALINIIKNEKDETESQAIDICRYLMSSSNNWMSVAKLLKDLDDDPERVRYAVLGYCSAVLLKDDNPKAGVIIDCFSTPFYNTGKAGLINACYQVYNAMLGD